MDIGVYDALNLLEARQRKTEKDMRTVLRWMHENGHLDRFLRNQDDQKADAELSDSHQ